MGLRKVKLGYFLIVLLSLLLCVFINVSAEIGIENATANAPENQKIGISLQENNSVSSEDEFSDEVENNVARNGTYGYERHPSRFAAVIVYCVVALVAVFAILTKYFITQYETLQTKAQLEYQQLQAMKP